MIKVKGIDHININVSSIDKAKEFYERFFGFKTQEDYVYKEDDGSATRFLLIGISEHVMLCLYENKNANADLLNSPLSHIGINVENFDEALLIARENDLLDLRWGVIGYEKSRSFYMKDPNGLGLEISEYFAGGH